MKFCKTMDVNVRTVSCIIHLATQNQYISVMGERKIDSGNERLKEIESRIVETRP